MPTAPSRPISARWIWARACRSPSGRWWPKSSTLPFESIEDFHRRYRDQRQSGRRVRLDRRAGRRQADAHGRRRGAPRAGRDGGRQARRCRRAVDGDRRRRSRRKRCRKEDQLRRTDRRAVLQRPSRLERQIRQSALRAGQGQAERSEGSQDRRPADQARRHRAEGLCPSRFRHRHQSPRHGAWPHDPAAGRRRRAGQGRRKLDQGYPIAPRSSGTRASSASSPTRSGTRSRRRGSSRSSGRSAAPPFPDQATLYDHIRKAPARKREVEARRPAMSTMRSKPRRA